MAAAVVAGFFIWKTSAELEPIPSHRLVRPEIGDIVDGVLAIGRVEPRTRIEVKSKANGLIRKLYVDVNDRVTPGQVIAELDKEILEARVDEAEAKVRQARAELARHRALLVQLELEKKDPEFAFAERHWKRTSQLHADGVASEDELDLARERHEKAQYRLEVVDAQIEVAKASIVAAEGRLAEVEALASLARQELEEADIRSPIDGVVLYRFLEEGDAVSSIRVAGGNSTVIMTIGDLSELYVDGEVDEADVGRIISHQRIRPDLVARITVDSYKDRKFVGHVTRITPLGLEDMNGIVTFEVRISLENPEKLLLANMTANSLIVLEEKKDVLLISQGALVSESGTRYAIVYDPATGRSERRTIQVGISDGSQVEVSSGLDVEQQIVIP
jgi:HlyD family secretion protein